MEKNEAFRKQVLSRLYGLPDPTSTESAKEEEEEETTADKDVKPDDEKEAKPAKKDEEEKEESKSVKKDDSEVSSEPVKPDEVQGETGSEKDVDSCGGGKGDQGKEVVEDEAKSEVIVKELKDKDSGEELKEKDKDAAVKTDHKDDNGSSNLTSTNTNHKNSSTTISSSKSITTPTTTTSHLYSVLMAPLDGRSPYRDSLRSSSDLDTDSGPRKRLRLDNSMPDKPKSDQAPESGDHIDTKTTTNTNVSVGMDLTKNQKRRLKKKKRKNLLNRIEVQRAKDFIYSSENEQYSVEKLRTMIEDVTEFLDAIWDVYCSEARVKGENVEEDGYRAAAVLKCLSASGEGSWGDLQLLSRAKSVLVLRNKQLAASTIARVDNELGYDADIRTFIVRMLKFWMDEIVTKG